MTRILLIGAPLSENFGGPSLLASTVKVLRYFIPKAEFTFLSEAQTNSKLSELYSIELVPYTRKSILGCLLGPLLTVFRPSIFSLSTKILKEYKRANIVIDIWGLLFADSLVGGLKSSAFEGIHLLVGKLLNKPVIKYTADIGPFEKRWNRFFAKFYLNNIDLIFARSRMTEKCLRELGVTTPIHVCPDTAFLLESAPAEEIHIISQERLKDKNLVGISVSYIAERKERSRGKYIAVMAEIADYLIHELNAFVILIPNEVSRNKYSDLHVAKRIYEKMEENANVVMLKDEYRPSELKGIIGKCDLLIGARYHSLVAATSMCIPTLAICWHHKYHELMQLVGQEEYVCDIESLSFVELREKTKSLWKNKERVRAEMASRIPLAKKSVLSTGKMVKEMLRL